MTPSPRFGVGGGAHLNRGYAEVVEPFTGEEAKLREPGGLVTAPPHCSIPEPLPAIG